MKALKRAYFSMRERVRFNRWVSMGLYLSQSAVHSNSGPFRRQIRALRLTTTQKPLGVALCCRIRDEARYLEEWIEYYLAAGINHFFFYEKLSQDDYRDVLKPYVERGQVTLFDDWPHTPVSPTAEQDCILRSAGRFEWVGFIDADEFVVIADNRSIGEFLSEFHQQVGVALHWRMFGSNGHILRPAGPVIAEYTARAVDANHHVKCFVRPESVANYRNSHSWYYQRMRHAVTERGHKVWGSFSTPPTAEIAWINHYHHKSDQDYFEKAARKSVLDVVGMRFETRSNERHAGSQRIENQVFDDCALRYYTARCRGLAREPSLLARPPQVLSQSA